MSNLKRDVADVRPAPEKREWPAYILKRMPKAVKAGSYEEQAAWVGRFREEKREGERRQRGVNPEKDRDKCRRWREANPERAREQARRRRAANPEKVREKNRRWREDSPESYLVSVVKRGLKFKYGIENPPQDLVDLHVALRLARRALKQP